MAASYSVKAEQFEDPRWRLENLYFIMDEKGVRVPFRPNTAQTELLDNLHSRNIILKARQLGFTTLCCLIYLDACIFTPNTRAGVIAHRLEDAKVIFRDRVKFPYDELDEGLKQACPATQDNVDTLTFGNNSSIRVATSMRSGTLQWLHVSEFGKICAQFPEKAREIITGSLNTVAPGQFVAIESTAEGQEGKFYEMCEMAEGHKDAGKPLTDLDYKFHFFPWWNEPRYALDAAFVPIGEEYAKYFTELDANGITLTPGQQAWYVKQDYVMGGDMKREYPATPAEAFEQAIEGAYYKLQLDAATKHGRIGGYPYDPRYLVNTFWDLGRNDNNTIWLHQMIKGFHRFVGYYENSGEHISHYIRWLRDWADDRDAVYGDHYLPHDGDKESLWLEDGTRGVMDKLKFRPLIVKRPTNKIEAIGVVRTIFPRCHFDEVGCELGLKRLRHYRKDWDEQRGVWKDRPRHDENSHGADGFQTFALAPVSDKEKLSNDTPIDRHRAAYNSRNKQAASWMTA